MHGAHDGRFAPSPTGSLHLGNLRTALAAWLFARAAGGRFLMRIDDIDPDRSRAEHERSQLHDLRALGLDWDGAPIRQTDRMERYRDAIDRLRADEQLYPCFCTRAEVRAAASAPHGATTGRPGGPAADAYPGTCGRLAPAASAARIAAGDPYCLRARAERTVIGFDDALLGRIEHEVDDFVVRRRDGVPAYNLASTIDEHDLGIGEVVRGADLADTTPRQLWLARVLRLEPAPRFAHVPLVLGADGERLAKRHGATSLAELAELGVDATVVLALLAASLGIDIEPGERASAAQLADRFHPECVPRTPVQLDRVAWSGTNGSSP